MFKEQKINSNLLEQIFGNDREKMITAIKEVLDDSEQNTNSPGVGTSGFIRRIIGPHYANTLSSQDFKACKDQVMQIVKETKDERHKRIRDGARGWRQDELKRTGVDPEEYTIM